MKDMYYDEENDMFLIHNQDHEAEEESVTGYFKETRADIDPEDVDFTTLRKLNG